jgi:predicted nucleic acid-binding protein
MALSAVIQGVRRIALDTAPLIYMFERHPVHFEQVESVIAAIDARVLRGVVSSLALLETLVGPIQSGNAALADTYRRALISAPNLELVPVDEGVAELAATIRAQHRFKTPDAIHLATAVRAGVDVFLTNDAQLRAFTGVRVLTVEEL